MTWFTGIIVYLLVWWLVLFTVLPWGNRAPEKPASGHAESAPERPRLWLKVLVTSLVAAVIWGMIYWLVASDLISFYP